MKNILIIETSRDNSGAGANHIESIDSIIDPDIRKAVENAINGVYSSVETDDYSLETSEGAIYSEGLGYFFSQAPRKSLPYVVEHIIEHCIN